MNISIPQCIMSNLLKYNRLMLKGKAVSPKFLFLIHNPTAPALIFCHFSNNTLGIFTFSLIQVTVMQNINLPLYIQHKEKYIHIANSTLNDSYFISIATG